PRRGVDRRTATGPARRPLRPVPFDHRRRAVHRTLRATRPRRDESQSPPADADRPTRRAGPPRGGLRTQSLPRSESPGADHQLLGLIDGRGTRPFFKWFWRQGKDTRGDLSRWSVVFSLLELMSA